MAANTKKNSTDEFNESRTDASFSGTDEREDQVITDQEAEDERARFASSGFGERERSENQSQELLLALLARYPQNDESIRRIVSEEVARFARAYPPVKSPVEDEPEAVTKLKARIAVLKSYYPVTWV